MSEFLAQYGGELLIKTWEQIYISAIALCLGIIVAVPIGVALTRFPKLAKIFIGIASILQTIPSLALLAIMIPFLASEEPQPLLLCLFILYCQS